MRHRDELGVGKALSSSRKHINWQTALWKLSTSSWEKLGMSENCIFSAGAIWDGQDELWPPHSRLGKEEIGWFSRSLVIWTFRGETFNNVRLSTEALACISSTCTCVFYKLLFSNLLSCPSVQNIDNHNHWWTASMGASSNLTTKSLLILKHFR